MHILFLSDNFPPETNAPATRLFEHARAWVRAGHAVTVVTCAPNFPGGVLHAGYANRWRTRERVDGIDVVRVKTFMAENRGFALRVLDYLSFMANGALAGLCVRDPDVVVGTSPQFFAAAGAWFVAALRRKPFVFELRDLWPASIAAVGAMRASAALRALERVELFLYRRAARVVALTHAFRDDLARRGIDAAKIDVVRNGVDLERYRPRPRDAGLERALGLEGKVVVGYLGTHGMAHALERVLDAAELCRANDRVRFLFAGAGAERGQLERAARARSLDNVSFLDSRPKDEMPRLWSVCDLALVHLRNDPLFATVIPSKVFEAFGMGVPVLYAGPEGEASGIVRAARAGVVVEPESPERLARAILFLAGDPVLRRKLSNAAAGAAPRFDRERMARAMLRSLERAAGVAAADRARPVPRHRRAAPRARG